MIIHPIDSGLHRLKVAVFQLDQIEKEFLLNECFVAKNKSDYQHQLAGNLEEEYNLPEHVVNKIQAILTPLLIKYHDRHLRSMLKTIANVHLVQLWTNFQKKHEYNPCHNHGGLLSFVIWLQIPYSLVDEFNHINCRNNADPRTKKNSIFEFIFAEKDGMIAQREFYVDKSWEGMGVIFPSKLSHTVYPFFTSDDYRISVSGNFMIK